MSIVGDPEFVEKLERKLAKFKKSPDRLNSKDILSDLSHHRQASTFLNNSDETRILEDGVRVPQPNILIQKICPEKIAVTTDELQSLVEKDELGILVDRLQEKDEKKNQNDVDGKKS